MSSRKFFVGGNFKMNGSRASLSAIIEGLNKADLDSNVEIVIAPPAVYLGFTKEKVRQEIEVAAQNMFDKPSGAYTGEIAADQLKDIGIGWVILGHSERRTILGESDEVESHTKWNFTDIVCSLQDCICFTRRPQRENLDERESDKTLAVVTKQLEAVDKKIHNWENTVIAYEPIWAIGTGKAAVPEQAQEVHSAIRKWLAGKIGQEKANSVRIIYGGSVNAQNCREFASCPDVDGFLVGGASLKPEFHNIVSRTSKKTFHLRLG
ncbi:Triosephosphate isomerase [Neolecta irregularis DAH-3]|uniref:Triosephosphate isomerase n=1 Tax=Neolecta irregularis (strain DAH-3) TaxID=1198029 RepID=A0A1U7LTX1_NEOID|nr:Triosephosphate isomerase [Neolecta irregularis DAH-3]|eukprot:OLL25992.1 Triosephosphate isomerase [Neolecta irregularis DAH-3]